MYKVIINNNLIITNITHKERAEFFAKELNGKIENGEKRRKKKFVNYLKTTQEFLHEDLKK